MLSCENSKGCCFTICSFLHTLALALLLGTFFFLLGLAVGSQFATLFAEFTTAIVAAAIGVFVIFLVALYAKCCCKSSCRQ